MKTKLFLGVFAILILMTSCRKQKICKYEVYQQGVKIDTKELKSCRCRSRTDGSSYYKLVSEIDVERIKKYQD